MPAKLNLLGQKFGRLTVVEPAENRKGKVMWTCLCDCGNKTVVASGNLRSGTTKSCGCVRAEKCGAFIRTQRRKKAPMIGKRFGRLVVVEDTGTYKAGDTVYKCLCDCGNSVCVKGHSLRSGKTKSCGCLVRETSARLGHSTKGRHSEKLIDLTGQRFGRLTVLRRGENSKYGGTRWVCLCDCGQETLTSSFNLRKGFARSCGCYKSEATAKAKTKHGMSHTSLFGTFHAMHNRCENPKATDYRWYGGKGVRICKEWEKPEPFFEWAISHGWSEGLTIDRIDSNKDYCPENCQWVTQSENSRRANLARRR